MIKQYFTDLQAEFNGYNTKKLSQDLLAGLTVAAVALPLALAFGVSSGADASAGLITAIIGGIIIGVLSGASYQISGPTGTMTAILIILVSKYGIQGVFVATLLAGIFRIAASLFKFGKLVGLIPAPVITGFTSGIAIIIALSQIDNFFGVHSEGTSAADKLSYYFNNGFMVKGSTMIIGCLVVFIMIFWPKKWNSKVPSSLVGIMVALIYTLVFKVPVKVVGDIPKTLLAENRLNVMMISWDQLRGLTMPALSIAVLGMIETLLCGASAGRMKGEKMNADRELIAQGIGNIILPFFGGVPATAAIARTSVAIKAGSQTRLTGVFNAMGLLASMFLLGNIMSKIPLAALAGVLMVTAWRMNEWESIKFIFNKRLKAAIAKFLITMAATVVFDLTIAIIIGIIFSVLLFMVRISELQIDSSSLDLDELKRNGITIKHYHRMTKVVYLTGPIFFTTAERICDEIAALEQMDFIIFSLRGVSLIDTTGVQALSEVCEKLKQKGTQVMFSSVQPKVKEMMKRNGLVHSIGKDKFFWNVEKAIKDLEHNVKALNSIENNYKMAK